MERRDVGMPGARPALLHRVVEREERLREAQGIAVPAGKVQVRRHVEMVEAPGPAHEVVGDEPVRRVPAQDADLFGVERDDLVGGEPAEVQPVRRVGLGDRQLRQVDPRRTSGRPSTRSGCPRRRSAPRSSRSARRAMRGRHPAPPATSCAPCRGSHTRCRSASPRPPGARRSGAPPPRRSAGSPPDRSRWKSSSGGASRTGAAGPPRHGPGCRDGRRPAISAGSRSACP